MIIILKFFNIEFMFFFKCWLFRYLIIILDGFVSIVRVFFERLIGIKGRLFIRERFLFVLKCCFKYFYMYLSYWFIGYFCRRFLFVKFLDKDFCNREGM